MRSRSLSLFIVLALAVPLPIVGEAIAQDRRLSPPSAEELKEMEELYDELRREMEEQRHQEGQSQDHVTLDRDQMSRLLGFVHRLGQYHAAETACETCIVPVKHVDVNALADILSILNVEFVPNETLRTIALSGPRDRIRVAQEAIASLDVPPQPEPVCQEPPQNVELTVHLIQGTSDESGQGKAMEVGPGGTITNMPGSVSPPSQELPESLVPVVDELKKVFVYKHYKMMETMVVRTRVGESAEVAGVLPSEWPDARSRCRFCVDCVTCRGAEDGTHIINLEDLELMASVPMYKQPENLANPYRYSDSGISAQVDVREGQQVVVGKATLDGSHNAMFVVVSAQLIDLAESAA